MANSEESQMISQRLLQFQERSKGFGKPASTARRLGGTGLWSHFLSQEWSSALLYLFLDVVSWLAIYRVVGWFRFDAFYATPFQFFIVNIIQLGVIVAALYFVGGYDRTVEKLTLGYAAEHILAIIAAAMVSAMLIYSAATFDQTMKPSRGVLLLSFAVFLPSLAGLPPMDQAVCRCQQRWPIVSRHRRRRDGGSFLRGVQELVKRAKARVRRCD